MSLQGKQQQLDVSQVLGAYYVRYDKLLEINSLLPSNLVNNTEVDVYIDLKNMLKKLYEADVFSNKRFSICAAIINLAAHIRGYYRSRHKTWARIFLVYGEDSSLNHRQFYNNFGDEQPDINNVKHTETDKFISSQLELVKILCAYINELYFVHKRCDFSSFTYDSICANKNRLSIIITKSKYAFQIPPFTENAVLIRPKKSFDMNTNTVMDTSYLVTRQNALCMCYMKNKTDLTGISPQLISLLWALNGLPEKHMHQLVNLNRAAKMISDAINQNQILNRYMTYNNMIYDSLLNLHTIIDRHSFRYRFYTLDLVYQSLIYQNQVEHKDFTWKIDLRDPETVKNINNQYFIDNPLDLINL